jgi:hypothetical protein
MSKPKWAPGDGSWVKVKPEFWPVWRDNKTALKKSGYSVRKTEAGEWEVRYTSPDKISPNRISPNEPPSPPIKSNAIFVKNGFKASLCLDCGQVDLIPANEDHGPCTICGAEPSLP